LQRVNTRSFHADTAVEALGDGRYACRVCDGWDIGGKTNGGYLLAIAARAMARECGRPDPVTVTAHYLAPAAAGPAEAQVSVLKSGRRFAVGRATLQAGGKPLLAVLGTFGDLGAGASDIERVQAVPPELPPPEHCSFHDPDHGAPPMSARVDMRLHPDDAGFARGNPSGEARVRGWFRLRAGEPADTLALLLAVDAFPPTVFNARLPIAWTPTIELTAHLRARPQPGWLRASFSTRFVSGGFLEEDGEIWDASGRLVAQSRQLALLPQQPSV
jgi:acyl-CoA thioesterase